MKTSLLTKSALTLAFLAPALAFASGGAAPKSLTQFDGVYKLQTASQPKLCPDEITITGKDEPKELDFLMASSLLRESYEVGEHCWVDYSQDFPHQECNTLKVTSDTISVTRKVRDTPLPSLPWLFADEDKRELVFNGSGGMTLNIDDADSNYTPQEGSCTYSK